jgi:Nif-specific regulatory protein
MNPESDPRASAADLLKQAASDLDAVTQAPPQRGPAAQVGPLHPVEDRLREVMQLARQVSTILELRPLLDAVVEAFVRVSGGERGFLVLRDADGGLDFQAAHDLDPNAFAGQEFAISRAPVQEAAESGRSVFVDDVLAEGRYGARESIMLLRLRSFACVPLVHAGRVLGVAYSDSRRPARVLSEGERALLEDFARCAAVAIANARRHVELSSRVSQLEAQNQDLQRQIERRHRFASILGESPPMQKLFATLEKVSSTAVNVLIQGETGTGKELIARAIHHNGPLRDRPLVTINAGAVPESLLESELFGHRKGSFTGAVTDRRGLFEEADGGTLFLDEIGETPPALQVKLLRVLQDGLIRPVGDNVERSVKVRIMAATHRNLEAAVRAGRFREDLFYRLSVVPIQVPPLRERGNDIVLLAQDFLRRCASEQGKEVGKLTAAALRWLLAQPWEGNVRQLQNCIERAVTLSEPGAAIDLDLLQAPFAGRAAVAAERTGTLREIVEAAEVRAIRAALEANGGKRSLAARDLGVSRQYLHTLINKYGLRGAPAGDASA